MRSSFTYNYITIEMFVFVTIKPEFHYISTTLYIILMQRYDMYILLETQLELWHACAFALEYFENKMLYPYFVCTVHEFMNYIIQTEWSKIYLSLENFQYLERIWKSIKYLHENHICSCFKYHFVYNFVLLGNMIAVKSDILCHFRCIT